MPVPEGQTGLRPYVDGAGHDIRLEGTRPVGPRLPSGRPYDLTALQDLEVHLSPSWAATPHPTPARGGLYFRRRPHLAWRAAPAEPLPPVQALRRSSGSGA